LKVWIIAGWKESTGMTSDDQAWFVKEIEPRYREILERMTKASDNDSSETIPLGKGPRGLDYSLEIFKNDPDDMDFAQMVELTPKMGVAIDLMADGVVREIKGHWLVGHLYEDGTAHISFILE